MVFLLLATKMKIPTILFPLRYTFAWYPFLLKSNIQFLAENHGLQSGVLIEMELVFVDCLHLTGKCYGRGIVIGCEPI